MTWGRARMALDPGSLPSSPSQKEQRKEETVAGSTGAEDQAEELCEREKEKARGQGVTKRCWDRLGKGGWLQTTPGKPDQLMLNLKTHTAFPWRCIPSCCSQRLRVVGSIPQISEASWLLELCSTTPALLEEKKSTKEQRLLHVVSQ